MKKLKTILRSRYIFKIFCFCVLIYSLLTIIVFPFQSKYQGNETQITGIVVKYQIKEEKVTLYVKEKEIIIVNYYFKEKQKNWFSKNLELGQKVIVDGNLKEPTSNTIPNLFNYKLYLKYKKIFYLMDATSLKIVKKNISVFYEIKNKITKRIDKLDNTGYLRTFLLGDKSKIDEEDLKTYQDNGISHLFSISGMHVSFLTGILLFFLSKITYNNRYKYSVIACFLIFYLFLTEVSASILRTVIMFLIFSINKCFNLKIKHLDLMLFTLSIALIINPFLLCDVGFQFSYLISISLILKRKKLKEKKSKFIQSLYLSCLCFFVSIPICLYHFGKINIFSIFLNLIMIPIVSSIIFPMAFLVFLVPMLFPIYEKMIWLLEEFNFIFSTIDFFTIIFIKPNLSVTLVYGIVILLIFYNKKYLVLFLILLIVHKCYPNIDRKFLMTILDVGQGDAIFIKLPYNQGNLLIDTGGIVGEYLTYNSSITDNKLIPYLHSLGITKLDYLILTHGDSDHMGESINFVKKFKVENVIFNKGEYNTLEKKLISVLKEKRIPYQKSQKYLKIKQYNFFFFNQTIYEDENQNSNILYFFYSNYSFLLLGDASIENEKEILKKYKIEEIDFLKVGHHGSNTSTDKFFIETIKPKISFISVGKNNRYGHPSEDVINKLRISDIYRTDQDGSIVIEIDKFCNLKTYSPKGAVNSRKRICV